jgi:hypothetical protein
MEIAIALPIPLDAPVMTMSDEWLLDMIGALIDVDT